ncbi:acyl-CoA N-acyltransferase [Thozetella sp. PMI_491]|nr:acyl-CoA N-acyltransferase [Thozetella sp. PMI_491]
MTSAHSARIDQSRMKRRRAPTNPLEAANRKTDDQFVADYLRPNEEKSPWVTKWEHPKTGAAYTIGLFQTGKLSDAELTACLGLVEETSRPDYENSVVKWHPRKKRKEMETPELRYVLVKDETGAIRGFTSLVPTYEDGEPVIYCYEVHLKKDLQGTGLGRLLMSFLVAVAENLPPVEKVMLTCFLANERGLAFYKKLGFEEDEISPQPRKLRFGKMFNPDYVILSKTIARGAGLEPQVVEKVET